MRLKILAAWILFDVACRALRWIFVERQDYNARRNAKGNTGAPAGIESEQHSASPFGLQKADQAIACRMAVAFGVALLGSMGVYLTTVESDSGSASRGVGTITAAAVNRAGAVMSVTRMDVEERLMREPVSPGRNRRQQAGSADRNVAEFRVATDVFSSARRRCIRAHGLCSP
jgi:hypothetical protein